MSSAIYPSLAGKHVLITGGGSGIGAAMVRAFARQGARVCLLDIADADAQALIASLADVPHPPVYRHCDLTDLDALQSTLRELEAAHGPVEVLVNNAANDDRHLPEQVTPAYWEERMAVNLRHQFFCAQAVAKAMRLAGQGVILNLGSISWHLALPQLSLYMTAKAAIEGMTRGLARDLGDAGIRVNCIVPGAVRTERQMKLWQSPDSEAKLVAAQCLQQRIEPEHVASMALFLASDDAARCSGREYHVDAGWYGG
jgi:NAD(P)-dependent dehydrogenase (short-subunit alcohol dehydrogenase family)